MVQKNDKGFTLIELLAAIVILSIIIIVFSGIFTNSFKSNAMTEDTIIGVNLAREVESSFNVDANKRTAMNSFITNVKGSISATGNYTGNANLLLKNRPEYSSLGLIEDITLTTKTEINNETLVQETKQYFVLKLDDPNYAVTIYMRAEPDLKTMNDTRRLYRLKIEVEDTSHNVRQLSNTYTFFEYK